MDALKPEQHLKFDTAVRLAELRLKCLELVRMDATEIPFGVSPVEQVVADARRLFDFVTDAPHVPDLFAVRRMDEAELDKVLGALDYIEISGTWTRWSSEQFAYRFRSTSEAEAFIESHSHLDGVMRVVPFRPGTPLWGPIYSLAG